MNPRHSMKIMQRFQRLTKGQKCTVIIFSPLLLPVVSFVLCAVAVHYVFDAFSKLFCDSNGEFY